MSFLDVTKPSFLRPGHRPTGRSFKAMVATLVVLGSVLLTQSQSNSFVLAASGQNTVVSGASSQASLYQAGVQAYRQGQFPQAISFFRQAQSTDPNNPNIRYYLAISLDQLSQWPEALLQYEYVIKNSQDSRIVDYSQNRLRALSPDRVIPKSSSTRGTVIVPLKTQQNALMVEATLNHDATGIFILDTGATYTSISREMAEQLKLDLNGAEKVAITTANGRILVPKVVIEHLSVNGLEARNVEATVIDVRKGSSFSGLLGLSFIRQFKLTIDPAAGQLVFQGQ